MRKRREFWIGSVHQHGRQWRFRVIDQGFNGARTFATREEAQAAHRRLVDAQAHEANARTIEQALTAFETYKRANCKPRTVDTIVDRLNTFFSAADRAMNVRRLTSARCAVLYVELSTRVAVDTHRGTLSTVKTFLNWCAEQKWIPLNPAAGVKGQGQRKKGPASKPQLRFDEVRKWDAAGLEICARGFVEVGKKGGRPVRYGIGGAAAALTTFYLGLRANEVASCVVRDLDNDGRLLWIPGSKTEASRRNADIPDLLQPIFAALAKGKPPEARLFGGCSRQWVNSWVQELCRLAGVPVVCAHAMRGLNATMQVSSETSRSVIAAALGHESIKTTIKHYAQPGSLERANQAAVLRVLKGGKKSSALGDEMKTGEARVQELDEQALVEELPLASGLAVRPPKGEHS